MFAGWESLQQLICITPPLKIIPQKCTIHSCLSNICPKLTSPAVLENQGALFKKEEQHRTNRASSTITGDSLSLCVYKIVSLSLVVHLRTFTCYLLPFYASLLSYCTSRREVSYFSLHSIYLAAGQGQYLAFSQLSVSVVALSNGR